MAYETDFIGVGADKATKDADAICLRWKNEDVEGSAAWFFLPPIQVFNLYG